jgi:hypothetical protein
MLLPSHPPLTSTGVRQGTSTIYLLGFPAEVTSSPPFSQRVSSVATRNGAKSTVRISPSKDFLEGCHPNLVRNLRTLQLQVLRTTQGLVVSMQTSRSFHMDLGTLQEFTSAPVVLALVHPLSITAQLPALLAIPHARQCLVPVSPVLTTCTWPIKRSLLME